MGKRLILILGGARSGKSAQAERLADSLGRSALYVATAEAGDEEMRLRIAKHRARRPAPWETLEAPRQVGQAVRSRGTTAGVVLLDCLTLLANNVLADLPEPLDQDLAEAALAREVDGILEAYQAGEATWIVVSNEVGLGLVPLYPLGRIYRDALGRANQRLAEAADEVVFMVAGIPMVIKRGS